jgi:hypothetical protein
MTKLNRLAALAILALAAAPSLAAAAGLPPMLPAPKGPALNMPDAPSHGSPYLDCRVHGLDFFIINMGTKTIDSGSQVAWNSPTTDDSNVVLLPKMLAPGEEVELADVLSDIPQRGAPCAVGFV